MATVIAKLYDKVHSMLVAKSIAVAHRSNVGVTKRQKEIQGVPAELKQQEGAALHKLWKSRHTRSQAEFCAEMELSVGYLPQFFKGLRPITLELALRFATELNVDVGDFSPRLARERDEETARSGWPFRRISREQYALLTPGQRFEIESRILRELIDSGQIQEKHLRRIV